MCPEGYYCPPASPFPFECYNGTYCPRGTEIAHICPLGWASRNDTVVRSTLQNSCFPCPPGHYGNDESRRYCGVCHAGYVCLSAATDPEPTNVTLQRGYICPKGYYCPG